MIVAKTGIGYAIGTGADALSQYAAFGTVNWQYAATSDSAVAGGVSGFLGGLAPGGGVAATEANAARETIVIGEDMAGRVIPTAESRGASVYSPKDAPPEQWMKNNMDWINKKMDEGCRILDCGAAPGRANYPEATSPYYKMELQQIKDRAYQLYQKISAIGDTQ